MFSIENPEIDRTELYVPVSIYLLNRSTHQKYNYAFIERAFYLTDESLKTTSEVTSEFS